MASLVERVQNILMKPAAEWDVIEPEAATVPGLYTGYACVLAAIPAIASVIGAILLLHAFIIPAIIGAVLQYVLALVGLFVISFIVDALAPSFGAQKSQIQAFKLVTYSSTAGWVAGVFNIIPVLGGLLTLLGGLYSLYTLYLGLPKLMKSPADKTVVYLLVIIVVAVLVEFVIALVLGAILAAVTIGMGAAVVGATH